MSKLPVIAILLFPVLLIGQGDPTARDWADSTLNEMSLDEKIGQLFMIRAFSDKDESHTRHVLDQIENFHVGGICFFQGTPQKQAELAQLYQKAAGIPLLVSMDAEWGLGMRHKADAISFPRQLTLGAINDNTLVYDMASAIATQLKETGVHVNFAPVVDVNNNPSNPVIHDRSFGEDIFNVSTKSYAYTKGLQDNGIMACAKHFPGHGDTDVDSHYDLPVVLHDRARLDSLELMPFRVMSQLGVQSMMVAHMSIPALDDRPHRPTSLSEPVINGLLRDKMHFEGLVFTDALEMKGVTKHFPPGEAEIEALIAGNDVLLLPTDLPAAFRSIKKALAEGRLTQDLIDDKAGRILEAKYNLGLHVYTPVDSLGDVSARVNSNEYLALKSLLYEKAVTLVQDKSGHVPIRNVQQPARATLAIGSTNETPFQTALSFFGLRTHHSLPMEFSQSRKVAVLRELNTAETVVISLHGLSRSSARNFGISNAALDLIYELNAAKNVILVNFGSPYALRFFPTVNTIIQSYEEDPLMQEASAQAIMGVQKIEGRLPVTAHERFPVKTGIIRPGIQRLGFARPEMVGISSDSLLAIDTIMEEMIRLEAAPGCQILAARNGRIFYRKNFGYHTYEETLPVRDTDMYDVASVTKTLATTIALMKMHDEGFLNIHKPLKTFIPQLDTTDKANLVIEDILAHHAGLPGWIPFYKETIDPENGDETLLLSDYYRTVPNDSFCVKISEGIYMRNDYVDSIYQRIYTTELRDTRDYRYSDLGYYLFKQIIEDYSKMELDQYVEKNFYAPLGLENTMFNPLEKVSPDRVVPTEKDDYFRCQVIHGHVHDMGAAMMGGVCGHAGLFSTATDLAILMQMLLNGGSYAGHQYIDPKTVHKFTRRHYKSSRRGLGFDMKELDQNRVLNMAEEASEGTFGHLGFTGISVFADPEYDLIYIFLSNRTYPTMKNTIFSKNNYRPRVQSVFYNAINK